MRERINVSDCKGEEGEGVQSQLHRKTDRQTEMFQPEFCTASLGSFRIVCVLRHCRHYRRRCSLRMLSTVLAFGIISARLLQLVRLKRKSTRKASTAASLPACTHGYTRRTHARAPADPPAASSTAPAAGPPPARRRPAGTSRRAHSRTSVGTEKPVSSSGCGG